MAGADVPGAGAISTDPITPAAQKTNFEALAEAVRRTIGVGRPTAADTYTISAGSITPVRGNFFVDTEGGVAADNLDWISVANFLPGSLIMVRPADFSHVVTMRHGQGGAGQLVLLRGADFALDNDDKWMLLEFRGNSWEEKARFFGNDVAEARAWLELGSVATLNNGAVDAATLEGNAAADFLGASAQAADSAGLEGLGAAAFVRADQASLQTVQGALRSVGGAVQAATALASGAPQFSLRAADRDRAQIFYDGVNALSVWRLLDDDGPPGTVLSGLRLRDGLQPEWWDKSKAAWESLATLVDATRASKRRMGKMTSNSFDALDGPFVELMGGVKLPLAEIGQDPAATKYVATWWVQMVVDATAVGNGVQGRINVHIGPNGDTSDPVARTTSFSNVVLHEFAVSAIPSESIFPADGPGYFFEAHEDHYMTFSAEIDRSAGGIVAINDGWVLVETVNPDEWSVAP